MSSGYRCYNCGKGVMVGHNVSHAKNRTRKVFKPNLHPAKITVEGTSLRVRLCTKCMRLVRGKDTRSLRNASQGKQKIEISTIAPASNAAGAAAAGLA